MLYGHPQITNDRKPPEDLVRRMEREWPKIRMGWHNEYGCWVLLQEPFPNHGQPWDFVLVCNNPATGNPKELGSWVFRFLEMNDPRKNDIVGGIRKAQQDAQIAAGKRRAAWRREEVSEKIARNLNRSVFPHAAKQDPKDPARSNGTIYKMSEGGLLIPAGG